MSTYLDTLSKRIRAKVERYRNREFMEAAMAACALVAMADRVVVDEERDYVLRVQETVAKLSLFDPHKAVAMFNDFTQALVADEETGREAALVPIAEVPTTDEDKEVLVGICVAVSLADGKVVDEERWEIAAICEVLGVGAPEI